MAKYKCLWTIKHNGKLYQPGKTIELTAAEASPLKYALGKIAKELEAKETKQVTLRKDRRSTKTINC